MVSLLLPFISFLLLPQIQLPPLNYLLPGLFDFKGETGSWKPVKTKGPSVSCTSFLLELHFSSVSPSFSTLQLH